MSFQHGIHLFRLAGPTEFQIGVASIILLAESRAGAASFSRTGSIRIKVNAVPQHKVMRFRNKVLKTCCSLTLILSGFGKS
jgi:hypothetical protein